MTQLVLPSDARSALGQDRQHRLDGRATDVPRRRPLPRHQVLAGGDLSDALRFEVRGFGIDVVLIEPGLITTEFAATAVAKAGDGDHRWPLCRVQREGLGAHHGCLRRPDAPPRRRPGCRGEGDREGDLPSPRALASAGDGLGAPVDPAAQAYPGPCLGRGDAHPSFRSPSSGPYAISGTIGCGRPTSNPWA